MPSAAAISSTAITPAALRAICAALRAAIGAIETWSSWPAEVGIESTLAGKARLLFSLTSAAAVTCGIIRPGIDARILGQERRQPAHLRIDEDADPPFRNRADLAQRHGDDVGGEGDRLGMEIAAGDRGIVIGEDDRIVGHRGRFDRQRARGILKQIERRAHHLRLAAEAVRVLHPAALDVAGQDLAAVEQLGDRGGDADLAGLAAQRRNARHRTAWREPFERIDRHRARGDRCSEHALALEQRIERERACSPACR